MTDEGEPNNKSLRHIVEGWGKAVPATSYYFYAYNLAEVSAPNPMITKWGTDIPIVYTKGACRYWQPETLPNFETCLHAHTLGVRLAWDPGLSPAAVVADLHEKFYGAAPRLEVAWPIRRSRSKASASSSRTCTRSSTRRPVSPRRR